MGARALLMAAMLDGRKKEKKDFFFSPLGNETYFHAPKKYIVPALQHDCHGNPLFNLGVTGHL